MNDFKAYFFVNPLGPPTAADYQHCVIAFAEGLKDLGIHFDANRDYYKILTDNTNEINDADLADSDEYLFKETIIDTDEDYNQYNILVTGQTCGVPDHLLDNKNRKYKTIILDWSDGLYNYTKDNVDRYDLYFITTYNKMLFPQNNVYPLGFSLTHRIINTIGKLEIASGLNFSQRENTLLYPHRVNHYIRLFMLKIYQQNKDIVTLYNDNFNNPKDGTIEYQHWHQSGRRHSIKFYNTLLNTQVCDCTGGYMFRCQNIVFAYQVDSFKLWEAFASGCAVITINFDRYNIRLPHQPKNGVHYIGITDDVNEVERLIKSIRNGNIDIEKIAKAGQKWALENYCPKGVASYIVNKLLKV